MTPFKALLALLFLLPIIANAESVELLRDTDGIQHVFAETSEGAYFGAGYAAAEDRMFQMDFNRKFTQGRLNELYYKFGTSPDVLAYNNSLFAHDFTMRVYGFSKHNKTVISNMADPYRKYLEAYTRGVNRKIREYILSGDLPFAYQLLGITNIEYWTASDSLDAWDRITQLFSGNNVGEEITNAYNCDVLGTGCQPQACTPPIDEAAAVVPPPVAPTPAFIQARSDNWAAQDLDFVASHAWAVRGTHTTTGKPVIAFDPKIQVWAPALFHIIHLHARDWDVRGAAPPGSPAMLMYWKKSSQGSMAQAITSSGGDTADLFEIIRSAGNTYQLDSNAVPFVNVQETIKTKSGGPNYLIGYQNTVFGPVLDDVLLMQHGNFYPQGRSFAVRSSLTRFTDRHSVLAALRAVEAIDFETYQSAVSDWSAPTANAILAFDDSDTASPGDVGYQYLGDIPMRQKILKNNLDYTGRYPAKGWLSSSDWGPSFTASQRPNVLNPKSGVTFSGNHLVVGSWYDAIAYSGIRGIGDTFRSHALRTLFSNFFETGQEKISPAEVHAMHFDTSLVALEIVLDILKLAYSKGDLGLRVPLNQSAVTSQQKAQKVMKVLSDWKDRGAKVKQSDGAKPLLDYLVGGPSSLALLSRKPQHEAFSCQYNEAEGGVLFMLKEFKKNPNSVYSPTVLALILESSAKSWDLVKALGFSDNPQSWPTQRPVVPTPVYYQANFFCSHPGAVTPEDCQLSQTYGFEALLDGNHGSTLMSSGGSVMTSTVDFSKMDEAMSMPAVGSTEDPFSPFFNNMISVWQDTSAGTEVNLPLAPFDRNQIPVHSMKVLNY